MSLPVSVAARTRTPSFVTKTIASLTFTFQSPLRRLSFMASTRGVTNGDDTYVTSLAIRLRLAASSAADRLSARTRMFARGPCPRRIASSIAARTRPVPSPARYIMSSSLITWRYANRKARRSCALCSRSGTQSTKYDATAPSFNQVSKL